MPAIRAVEYTDPSCSYAWGTEPKYRRLAWQYGEHLALRRVQCGIIARGWHEAHGIGLDTEAMRDRQTAYWAEVSALTGAPHPDPVRRVMTWSEDACRVAKAAEAQGDDVAERVLRRLRESWHVAGLPADTVERGLQVAAGVAGLDPERLARDVADPATEAAYRADWEEARRPNDYVRNLPDRRVGRGAAQEHNGRMRYGLPCLVLTGPAGTATVAGWRTWREWEEALEAVAPGLAAEARPRPTPAEAFARWPTMTRPELDELCGAGAEPPAGVGAHTWPGGLLWRTTEEAAAWDLTQDQVEA